MSYGTFQVAGVQSGTPSGGTQSLGPFAIAFGPVVNTELETVNTTVTIPVPSNALGVWVIPPIGNTTPTLAWSTTSSGSVMNIAPGSPSYWAFDTAHLPANLYLVSGSSVNVVVQFV
jgi:hypothetical protein